MKKGYNITLGDPLVKIMLDLCWTKGEVLDLRFSFSFFGQWIGNAKEEASGLRTTPSSREHNWVDEEIWMTKSFLTLLLGWRQPVQTLGRPHVTGTSTIVFVAIVRDSTSQCMLYCLGSYKYPSLPW